MLNHEDLWRGKIKNSDEWVYGSRVTIGERCFILPDVKGMLYHDKLYEIDGFVEVEPFTLGKYTGVDDCDETHIFGGDIVALVFEDSEYAEVYYSTDAARFVMQFDGCICGFSDYYCHELKVLSNMYDHPEYLGRGNADDV